MSHSTTPVHGGQPDKIFSINWRLLGRRLTARGRQLRNSARYHADRTEYIPPIWMSQLRLTWFRLGLMALTVFVFTQKQVDFTVTLGNRTAPAETETTVGENVSALSILPSAASSGTPAARSWSVEDYPRGAVEAYVERFARVARTEEEKFAIPAPAKMAMAILESDAGKHADALDRHNHFPSGTSGRSFDNAWSSWRTHSELLSRRFPELANESVNYQQWIAALARSGYSRDPQYAQKLLSVIQHFHLAEL